MNSWPHTTDSICLPIGTRSLSCLFNEDTMTVLMHALKHNFQEHPSSIIYDAPNAYHHDISQSMLLVGNLPMTVTHTQLDAHVSLFSTSYYHHMVIRYCETRFWQLDSSDMCEAVRSGPIYGIQTLHQTGMASMLAAAALQSRATDLALPCKGRGHD